MDFIEHKTLLLDPAYSFSLSTKGSIPKRVSLAFCDHKQAAMVHW